MAEEVARLFCSHLGVAVVGYAAPVPEKNIEMPHAFYAIYAEGRLLETARLEGGKKEPLQVQLYYVNRIIDALHRLLL